MRQSDRDSVTVRIICSVSLVALYKACLTIARGDCDGAIVGGANLIITLGVIINMTE